MKVGTIKQKINYIVEILRLKGIDFYYLINRLSVSNKLPIQKNKILVATFDNKYSCNPKYIVEEILKKKLPVEIVWAVPVLNREKGHFPEEVRLISQRSRAMFYEMATSKIWIDNSLMCSWNFMHKRREQIYIDTWHGSMGIKKLTGSERWEKRAYYSAGIIDYFLTNSVFEEEVFHKSFWPNTAVLPFGHPRNDVFFDPDYKSKVQLSVRKKLGLSLDSKILLYAPTFRDSQDKISMKLNVKRISDVMSEKFGGEWTILFRAHMKTHLLDRMEDNVIDVSEYDDMQELMLSSDAGITDYSSWAYDYVLSGKPCFLYVYDRVKYDQERGLYYPLSETPFSIAETEESLIDNISEFDQEKYQQNINEFLERRGCYEKGSAAKNVVTFIMEQIEN